MKTILIVFCTVLMIGLVSSDAAIYDDFNDNSLDLSVSFRQACMNRIQKNDTIGCPTIQRRITDGIEKLPNPTTQSQRSQRAI